MRRPAILLIGLVLFACAGRPEFSSSRVAVGSMFACFACASKDVVCSRGFDEELQARLPRTPRRGLRRLAAGSKRVCGLWGSELRCWDYSPERRVFMGPTRERGVVDFDLANRVTCVVTRAGDVHCAGDPQVEADFRASTAVESTTVDGGRSVTYLGVEDGIGVTERVIEERRHVPGARARRVAAHYWGACYATQDEGVHCWMWGGDRIHEVVAPGVAQILDLHGIDEGIEISTTNGARMVRFHKYGFGAPIEAVATTAVDPAREWAHGHVVACRAEGTDRVACRSTVQHNSGEPSFSGWRTAPQCGRPPWRSDGGTARMGWGDG